MVIPHISPALDIHPNVVVVGSGSILLEKEQGELIDSFDEVVRFNRAPTKGFEKFVGSKTTTRVANQHVFAGQPWKKRWDSKTQPQHFIREQKNCKIVCMGPNGKRGKVHETSTAHLVNYSKIPKFAGKQPTVGLAFTWLLIQADIVPHLYGFFGEPGGKGKNRLTHYWEKRDNKSICHDYSNERKLLTKWHNEGQIIWEK